MQVFSIHLRPSALTPDKEAILVKEGFCWPAFFFGPFWALSHRMWFAAIGLLAGPVALGGGGAALQLGPMTCGAVMVGIATIIGFCANDWRRNALDVRGWDMEGLSAAPDPELALRRFFDLRSDSSAMQPDAATGSPSQSPGYWPVAQ